MKERHHPHEADSSPGRGGSILTDTRRQVKEERRSPLKDVYNWHRRPMPRRMTLAGLSGGVQCPQNPSGWGDLWPSQQDRKTVDN
ncbi:hypothetical protein PG996_000628 [Apiospora saccharicola]|uniref:Uncharacterized protein n=1 Tax=Apiospora saccharicola TaxID=335842 RepID=A0ABR1WFQ8_9PEZI